MSAESDDVLPLLQDLHEPGPDVVLVKVFLLDEFVCVLLEAEHLLLLLTDQLLECFMGLEVGFNLLDCLTALSVAESKRV